jgi:hypothetical protein
MSEDEIPFEDEYPYDFPVDDAGQIAKRLTWRERATVWLRKRFGKALADKPMEILLLTTQQITMRCNATDIRGERVPHGPVFCESSDPSVASITVDPADTDRIIVAGQKAGRTRIRCWTTGATLVADVLVLQDPEVTL